MAVVTERVNNHVLVLVIKCVQTSVGLFAMVSALLHVKGVVELALLTVDGVVVVVMALVLAHVYQLVWELV